jgi:pimeloyl-ACP methyl ester carboxylesterase
VSKLHSAFRSTKLHASSTGAHIVLLPGWLGWANRQYAPVMSVLRGVGSVTGIDYTGPYFNSERIIRGVASGIAKKAARDEQVILLGSSLGAMVSLYVLEELTRSHRTDLVSAVLIDPPSGADSLKGVPTPLGPLAAKLGHLPLRFNKGPVNKFFQKAFCSGIKDDAPIEVPAGTRDKLAYRKQVQRECYEGQQGFSPTLSFGELAWMCRVGNDGTLARATTEANGQFTITHIACTGDNEVVLNPLAQDFYKKHLPSARFLENPTNHTDFSQMAPSWRQFLSEQVFV